MAVRTSRTSEEAVISIDYSVCTHCGLCAKICKDLTIIEKDGEVFVSNNSKFGCIGCGQCAAICPLDCITITGREISMKDFIPLPVKEKLSTYDQLFSLMFSRRSVRDYRDKEVPSDIVNKIIGAASTSPMGIPPSDVQVLVLNGKEKVRNFAFDVIDFFASLRKILGLYTTPVMALFMKKTDREMMKSFIIPVIDFLIEKRKNNEDWLLYNAPLAIYFYATPFADTADPYIAATYAMLAAESLGLGSCMIGTINPFLEHGGNQLKDKYGILRDGRKGIVVIFGYPKYKYQKGIIRTFGKITFN